MVQVQNKINYGVAYVSQDQADGLGSDWQEGSSLTPPPFVPPWAPGTDPVTPEVDITLQRVDMTYLPNRVVQFTIVKGAVNDPGGDEAFYFACTQETNLNGYVTGRSFTRTFSGVGPYSCSLEDMYGDGVSDSTRKKVTFTVTPVAAAEVEPTVAPVVKKTAPKKAPAKKE
jgi:hypothetical protein